MIVEQKGLKFSLKEIIKFTNIKVIGDKNQDENKFVVKIIVYRNENHDLVEINGKILVLKIFFL